MDKYPRTAEKIPACAGMMGREYQGSLKGRLKKEKLWN